MGAYLYPAFLVALFAVPLVATWRWGYGMCLTTTLVALLLIVGGFSLLLAYGFFPGEAKPSPITPVQAMQLNTGAGVVDIVAGIVIPGLAVLVGAGLSTLWTLAALLRGAIFRGR
jgi:hypothetical protein